jgi:hypothetical protein
MNNRKLYNFRFFIIKFQQGFKLYYFVLLFSKEKARNNKKYKS